MNYSTLTHKNLYYIIGQSINKCIKFFRKLNSKTTSNYKFYEDQKLISSAQIIFGAQIKISIYFLVMSREITLNKHDQNLLVFDE